jgi:hypothetical protein
MKYRRRILFTDKQKSEIWDRWQRGESMSSIGRVSILLHNGLININPIGPSRIFCQTIIGSDPPRGLAIEGPDDR